MKPLTPKTYWSGTAVADTCTSDTTCKIGGFVHQLGQSYWFSEIYNHSDFQTLGIDLDPKMQKSISSFESLAQIALLYVTARFFPAHRMPICLKSLSDNTFFFWSAPVAFRRVALETPEWTSRDSNHHRQSVSAGKTNAIPTEPSGRRRV